MSASDIINTTLAQAKDQMIKKLKWKMMVEIKKLIQQAGGNIYGGFVRDQIIHDHHADYYYYEYAIGQRMTDEEINDKYNNPEILPEHKDRCLIPSDIDCFMTTQALQQFKTVEIKKKHYYMRIKSSQRANFYFLERKNSNILSELQHTKAVIYFNINKLLADFLDITSLGIEMDIIHTENKDIDIYKELSQNFDFECNSLILNSNDEIQLPYSISKNMSPFDKLKRINSIIEDIKKKKAVMIGNDSPASFRVAKMIKKGWQIEAQPFQIVKLTEPYPGYCVICHEDLQVGRLHIKDRNCDARFHPKCYLTMVRFEDFKHECPLCKVYCNVTSREQHAIEIIHNMDCRENDDLDNIIRMNAPGNTPGNAPVNILQNTPVVHPIHQTTLFGVNVNHINTMTPQNNIIRPLPPPPRMPARRIVRGDMFMPTIPSGQSIFENNTFDDFERFE